MRKVKIVDGKAAGKVGWFHNFFTYADEDGGGAEAVIEFKDGSCERFPCEWFKFITPPNNNAMEAIFNELSKRVARLEELTKHVSGDHIRG